jgi:hypothetical protein
MAAFLSGVCDARIEVVSVAVLGYFKQRQKLSCDDVQKYLSLLEFDGDTTKVVGNLTERGLIEVAESDLFRLTSDGEAFFDQQMYFAQGLEMLCGHYVGINRSHREPGPTESALSRLAVGGHVDLPFSRQAASVSAAKLGIKITTEQQSGCVRVTRLE